MNYNFSPCVKEKRTREMYFMSLRINLSAYSQGKTFTSAKDKDESSKSAHLTCKQITIEYRDLVEG